MKPFEYIAVETIAEACDVLAEHGAGRSRAGRRHRLADRVAPRLQEAAQGRAGHLRRARIGRDSRSRRHHHDRAAGDARGPGALGPAVRKFAPLLAAAAAAIGSPQIRVARHGRRQHHERRDLRGHRAAADCAGRDGDAAIQGRPPRAGAGRPVPQAVSDQSQAG